MFNIFAINDKSGNTIWNDSLRQLHSDCIANNYFFIIHFSSRQIYIEKNTNYWLTNLRLRNQFMRMNWMRYPKIQSLKIAKKSHKKILPCIVFILFMKCITSAQRCSEEKRHVSDKLRVRIHLSSTIIIITYLSKERI